MEFSIEKFLDEEARKTVFPPDSHTHESKTILAVSLASISVMYWPVKLLTQREAVDGVAGLFLLSVWLTRGDLQPNLVNLLTNRPDFHPYRARRCF